MTTDSLTGSLLMLHWSMHTDPLDTHFIIV